VAAGQGHDLDLLVQLRAPALPADRQRPPLCLVPVVDVSGSMNGAKLESVRYALERLVEHLVPGDYLGLVAFDSEVRTVAPLTEVTAARKRDLLRAIGELRAGSCTNLAGGLLEGVSLVRAARLAPGLRARVILLTDGLANEGVATTHHELAALIREQATGVTVSAFGYGDDCDQALLGELADIAGGSYAYIANKDVVLTAFARELGSLVSTCAADVHLRLVPVAGAPIEERLGDLLYEGELSFAAALAAPTHERATAVPVATIEARWQDSRGRAQHASVPVLLDYVPAADADATDDADVCRARDERLLRTAQEQAEAAARDGDFARARDIIGAILARLRDQTLIEFARDTLLPCYEEREYGATSGMRACAMASLKKRRRVASSELVPALADDRVSRVEADMVASFTSGKKPRKGR
jgi:Ca-activated chloride channel family protein